ncbi:hypothetical protein J6590_002512 [Homalodisca vitripennis]|nr:hypothetical protein J6590_002512 [Homalodisca vitripennis]
MEALHYQDVARIHSARGRLSRNYVRRQLSILTFAFHAHNTPRRAARPPGPHSPTADMEALHYQDVARIHSARGRLSRNYVRRQLSILTFAFHAHNTSRRAARPPGPHSPTADMEALHYQDVARIHSARGRLSRNYVRRASILTSFHPTTSPGARPPGPHSPTADMEAPIKMSHESIARGRHHNYVRPAEHTHVCLPHNTSRRAARPPAHFSDCRYGSSPLSRYMEALHYQDVARIHSARGRLSRNYVRRQLSILTFAFHAHNTPRRAARPPGPHSPTADMEALHYQDVARIHSARGRLSRNYVRRQLSILTFAFHAHNTPRRAARPPGPHSPTADMEALHYQDVARIHSARGRLSRNYVRRQLSILTFAFHAHNTPRRAARPPGPHSPTADMEALHYQDVARIHSARGRLSRNYVRRQLSILTFAFHAHNTSRRAARPPGPHSPTADMEALHYQDVARIHSARGRLSRNYVRRQLSILTFAFHANTSRRAARPPGPLSPTTDRELTK